MKILFAQLRKPPSESRFYERLGSALIDLEAVVFSAGSCEIPFKPSDESQNAIKLLPVFCWRDTELSDTLKNLARLLDILWRIRPDVLVFSSPEISLLLPLIKITLPGIRIVFDLQENHGCNIRHQIHPFRPRKIHGAIADFLVWLGMASSKRIWLAEKVFKYQLGLYASNAAILENMPPGFYRPGLKKNPPWIFCFTGFISRESGIIPALKLMDLIYQYEPKAQLLICGYCPDATLRRKILSHPLARFTNDPERWASSVEILSCMHMAAAQLMPYYESRANAGKTPSKWYASIASGLPVWHRKNSLLDLPLSEIIGFRLDMENPDPGFFEEWLDFYDTFSFIPEAGKWNSDPEVIRDEILRLFASGESKNESSYEES